MGSKRSNLRKQVVASPRFRASGYHPRERPPEGPLRRIWGVKGINMGSIPSTCGNDDSGGLLFTELATIPTILQPAIMKAPPKPIVDADPACVHFPPIGRLSLGKWRNAGRQQDGVRVPDNTRVVRQAAHVKTEPFSHDFRRQIVRIIALLRESLRSSSSEKPAMASSSAARHSSRSAGSSATKPMEFVVKHPYGKKKSTKVKYREISTQRTGRNAIKQCVQDKAKEILNYLFQSAMEYTD